MIMLVHRQGLALASMVICGSSPSSHWSGPAVWDRTLSSGSLQLSTCCSSLASTPSRFLAVLVGGSWLPTRRQVVRHRARPTPPVSKKTWWPSQKALFGCVRRCRGHLQRTDTIEPACILCACRERHDVITGGFIPASREMVQRG